MKIHKPDKPLLPFRQHMEKMGKDGDTDGQKIMETVLMQFARNINKTMVIDGQAMGLEAVMEALEELYDAGLIKFGYDEEKESFSVLKWDFRTGKYF